MSPEHLALIRKCACCLCHVRRGVEVHHLKSGPAAKDRGAYLRATDRWSVPLCSFHHRDVEARSSRNEIEWFSRYGIEPVSLAVSLWHARGDLARMGLIIIAHKKLAVRALASVRLLTINEAEEQRGLQ